MTPATASPQQRTSTESTTAMPTSENSPPSVSRRLKRPRTVADSLTQFGLPAVAIGLLVFAGWYVRSQRVVATTPPPPIEPSRSPFSQTLAASGVVEAQTENIAVGSSMSGVVTKVLVTVGDTVTPGTPLFQLDDRQLLAERTITEAALLLAQSELIRKQAEPRQEEVPLKEAAVNEARASVDLAKDAYRRAEETFAKKVTTEQDLITKRDELHTAEAKLAQAVADLDLLEAGSWSYDIDIAKAAVAKAEAERARVESDLDRLIVRALVAGEVLQVNVRPGEYVGTPPGEPLIVLGDVDTLHVRVDIDEFDIARFSPEAAASAVPRGSLQERYPLEFFRIEPYVVPKKSLTGDNSERVDTRVLQVVYTCDPRDRPPLFVGQQMEVFIETSLENRTETHVSPKRESDASTAGGGT